MCLYQHIGSAEQPVFEVNFQKATNQLFSDHNKIWWVCKPVLQNCWFWLLLIIIILFLIWEFIELIEDGQV